jgi:hypothetical protein
MQTRADVIVNESYIYPCDGGTYDHAYIRAILWGEITARHKKQAWLLRESAQGLGFLTLVYLQKKRNKEGTEFVDSRHRFYFDGQTKTWGVCPGDDLKQKHGALSVMKKNPDQTQYAQYLDQLHLEASMRQLFDLISGLGFKKSDNVKYKVSIRSEKKNNQADRFAVMLDQKFAEYERLDETVLSRVRGGLFAREETVRPESAAPASSRLPGFNPT